MKKSILLLLLLNLCIAVANFTPNTFLTGWDNLHPEFNFLLNIKRSLFSGWQQYQGLGLVGGMGHASDLPRQIFLGILSFVLPLNMLRYFYHFLMLFLGSVGVYILIKKIILEKYDAATQELSGLVGGFFYVLNLATLQMFYVPFEPFSHHFAALPWLLFGSLNYLKKPTNKKLLFLFIINVLAVPQGYVATFFLVTAMLLFIIYAMHFLKTKDIKHILVCYCVLFLVNAFWLAPNMYFLLYKTNVNVQAKINQMSTEDNFLKNKKFGDLADTAIFKGFWFDNVEFNSDGSTTYQIKDWIPHLYNKTILWVGYGLFGLSLIGIFVAWKKRLYPAVSMIPAFVLSFIVLSNDTPVLSQLANLFNSLPLFSQIFRFPFTKFAVAASMFLAIFYAMTFLFLIKIPKLSRIKVYIFALFIALPVIFMYPVFLGKFFDARNQIPIPSAYFQVFDFFKNQDKDQRIADFPQYTFWGWSFYQWGYRGSGILWYGIEQPILDRAFDVWSNESENYYYEMSYAVYSNNQALFENLLEKYQINWLLVDDSITSYSSQREIYFNNLNELITNSPRKINLAKTFGKIRIYKVDLTTQPKKFAMIIDHPPTVGPLYNWNDYDAAYLEYGNYISDPYNTIQTSNQTYYPLRSLFSGKDQNQLEFTVKDTGEYFSFQAKIPKSLLKGALIIPSINPEEIIEIDQNNLENTTLLYPQIFIDKELIPMNKITLEGDSEMIAGSRVDLSYLKEGNLEIRVPKINGYNHYDINASNILAYPPTSCNPFNTGLYEKRKIQDAHSTLVRLTSVGSSNCLDFDFPNLSNRVGYLVAIESRNVEGKSLLFSLDNGKTEHPEIETYLPKNTSKNTSYFILPPMEQYNIGYTLHFDNISFGRIKTVNDLGRITAYQIPYSLLTSLKIVKSNQNNTVTRSTVSGNIQVNHPNSTYYEVKTETSDLSSYVTISQSYDPNWRAYILSNKPGIANWVGHFAPFLFGEELKNHVIVNNWENGWRIDTHLTKQSSIVIVFLPQYLEYIGFLAFALLTVTIVTLFLKELELTR